VGPRRLVLVRHAKAEPFASTDHARALTERGREDARAAGAYLEARGVVPDHALVSTADRARQTWDAMAESLGTGATVVVDGAVYAGSTAVLLDALRASPADVRVLAFVGHQPTVGYVAHLLDDGLGDHDALGLMLQGFPTGSMAIFDIEVAWEDLAEETGRLVDFHVGRR
jgi:phosphohistidine phosphatase